MCLCVHDTLNFAADQAEIEIFHGLKKTAASEMGSEPEMEGEVEAEQEHRERTEEKVQIFKTFTNVPRIDLYLHML